jgi:hypothetical protein
MVKVKGRQRQRDYSLIDWSKSTTELAAELNIKKSNLSRLRRQFAPKTIDKSNKNKLKYQVDWFMVDWSKRNIDIAAELNIPKETIGQKRQKFAANTIKRREFLNLNK